MRLRIAILTIGHVGSSEKSPIDRARQLCQRTVHVDDLVEPGSGTDPSDRRHVALSVPSWRFRGGAEISAAGRALQDLLRVFARAPKFAYRQNGVGIPD